MSYKSFCVLTLPFLLCVELLRSREGLCLVYKKLPASFPKWFILPQATYRVPVAFPPCRILPSVFLIVGILVGVMASCGGFHWHFPNNVDVWHWYRCFYEKSVWIFCLRQGGVWFLFYYWLVGLLYLFLI